MKAKFAGICAAFAAAAAFGDVPGYSVGGITARQRWPWDGLVDIEFNLSAPPGEGDGSFTRGAKLKFTVAAGGVRKELAGLDTVYAVRPGRNRVIWNPGADFASGAELRARFEIEPVEAVEIKYMAVDLATGRREYFGELTEERVKSAEFRTAKMLMRHIPASTSAAYRGVSGGKDTFTMGAPAGEAQQGGTYVWREQPAEKRITKPFWMGVFPLTVAQKAFIEGGTDEAALRDTSAARRLKYTDLRGREDGKSGGGWVYPSNTRTDPESIVGTLRAKTRLPFDLPTEAQWEYACRAGTSTPWYWGGDGRDSEVNAHASLTLATGTKPPNPWGLYDMVCCVHQWTTTLGRTADGSTDESYALHGDTRTDDPIGYSPRYEHVYRITKGSHNSPGDLKACVSRCAYRYAQKGSNPAELGNCGARLSLTEW